MLSKIYRLTKKKDFVRVFKEGKYFFNQFISLEVVKNNLDISRFGFIVNLKVSKKSTVRNKIRRRLQEVVRAKLKKIKKGFDIVILTKPEIVNKSYQEIEKVLSETFAKAKVYD